MRRSYPTRAADRRTPYFLVVRLVGLVPVPHRHPGVRQDPTDDRGLVLADYLIHPGQSGYT